MRTHTCILCTYRVLFVDWGAMPAFSAEIISDCRAVLGVVLRCGGAGFKA